MLQDALSEKNEYYETLSTLESIFYSMHVLDLVDDSVVEFNSRDKVKEIVNQKNGATQMMVKVMSAVTDEAYVDDALEFTDLTTLADRMRNKKLITKSQTDELTGLFNRRAYEDDIYEHNDVPEEDDFVYVSLDVNSLKVVNDTLGHAAGDEFIAILFCDKNKLETVLTDFEDKVANWSGSLVDSLSVSYGWISKEESPDSSVRQLGFKQVMMEIIPANDYSETNQSLFLYVKSIDK